MYRLSARVRAAGFPVLAVVLAATTLGAQQKTVTVGGAAVTKPVALPNSNGVIEGFVGDTMLAPIPVAEVTVLRSNLHLFTNRAGRFRIYDVIPGQYILTVRRLGYRPISQLIEVLPNDTLSLSYTLDQALTPRLDTVRVLAKRTTKDLQEFEARRQIGVGDFLTQEQIERRGSVELSTLLQGFRSISIASNPTKGNSIQERIAYNRRDFGNLLTQGPGTCPMQVYVDGAPMPRAFDLTMGPLPSQIAGIEVYGRPSTAPVQFAGADRSCGLILIWTRVVR